MKTHTRLVGLVSVLVVAMSGLSPATATDLAAGHKDPSSVRHGGEGSERRLPKPHIAKAPRATGQAAVVVTTPTSRVVRRGQDVRAEYFSAPEFVQTDRGWKRLSGAVRARGGAVSTVRSAVPVRFGDANGRLATLDLGRRSVSMRLVGARRTRPRVVRGGSTRRPGQVRYRGVMRGVDLGYEVRGSVVKESLILTDRRAARKFTFLINDRQHRLGKVVKLGGGAYGFTGLSLDGMAVSLAAPMAWSRGGKGTAVPGDGSASQRVTRTRKGYRVVVGLDRAWARSARFPVTLDPTMSFSYPDSTLATAFGQAWWTFNSEECGENGCPAMFGPGGDIYLQGGPRYMREPYAGHVRMDLSNIPWWTSISTATLSADFYEPTPPSWHIGVGGVVVYPATGDFTAGDSLPPPNSGVDEDGEDDPTLVGWHDYDESLSVQADVTDIVRGFVEDQTGPRSGMTLVPTCGPCESRQVARKRDLVETEIAVLSNPSLTIEYTGPVLPPPLPVDQTFGCNTCHEWGTGPDAVSHDADPINTAAGSAEEVAIDASLTTARGSGAVLPWGRVFNGRDESDGPLGVGWTHPYNASVSESTDAEGVTTATFRDPTGGRWRWTRTTGGEYLPKPGVTARLIAIAGGGWRVRSIGGRELTFDAQGREVSDLDRFGRGMTLGYSAGRLASLTRTRGGATTTLTYGSSGAAAGRIVSVDLPGGRTVSYDYAATAGGAKLASVQDVTGETTTYTYDTGGQLAGITDPEGNTRAVNSYDAEGRVVGQAEPTSTTENPQGWTFEWQDHSGGETDNPDGTGLQTTTDPDGIKTQQYYYGNVLFRSVDAAGGKTDYTYDADANLVAVTDPLGYVTTMTYDSHGNLLTRTSPAPESITETWTYNAEDQATSYTNGEGETTTTTYTGGLPVSVTDPEGGVTHHTYNGAGDLTETTSPAGRTTEYAYDTAGNMTSQTTGSGATTTWTYDAAGNQLTETTPRGKTTTFTYNAAGRMLTSTDPAGTVTSYTYDQAGRATRTRILTPSDTILRDSGTTYDAAGRVKTQTLFDRTVAAHDYTAAGRLQHTVDAEGRDTWYGYDQLGRGVSQEGPGVARYESFDLAGRIADRYADGISTSFGYDSAGRQTTVTTDGQTTTTAYDDAGRAVTVTDPDGGVTTMGYDDNGHLTSQAAPGRPAAVYTYDADGNRLSATSPSGLSTRTWTYTPDGYPATETSPRGNAPGATPADFTTSYTYDADGNPTGQTDPLGNTWTTTYDDLGQSTAVEDPRGHVTGYAYDRLGQLSTVTAPDDSETSYDYDQYGNRIARTDARNHTTSYTYDAVGQLLTETDPLDRTQTYTYDGFGNLATHTNARNQTISYQYYWGSSRPSVREHDGTQDTFGYDDAGRLTGFTDSTGTTALSYNSRGLLTGVDQPGDDDYSYTYTPDGHVASRTYPSGAVISYTYTADGLTATQDRGGRTTSYGWDRDQHLTRVTYPTGVDKNVTRTLDRAGRITGIDITTTSTSAPLLTIDYDRNQIGAPTTITRTRGTNTPNTESFTYNDRDWLTRWCPASAACTGATADRVDYNYDTVGNQTDVTGVGDVPDPGTAAMTYDAADQRISTVRTGGADPGTTSYTWDADGNLITGGRTYNALGRLTTAQNVSGDAVSYTYNATGQRRTITANGETTTWSWDLNSPLPMLARTIASSGPAIEHDFTPDGWALSSGQPGAQGDWQWYTNDALGSTVDTYDAAGAVLRQLTYDPWGDELDDAAGMPGAVEPAFGYTSAVADPATADWHLRARDYIPDMAVFLTVDPAERPIAQAWLTPYSYADLQPTLLTDPSGLCSWGPCPPPEPVTFCLASGGYCSGPPPVYGPSAPLDPHIAADLAGIVNPWADVANAGWYAAEGSWWNAGLSIFCAVPLFGDAAALIRSGSRVGKSAGRAPGVWATASETMSSRAAAYQARITGRTAGSVYVVEGVKFDGFANGVLLEAKGPGYAGFVENGRFKPWFSGAGLVSQAQRQLAAAGGLPIQWSVAEAEAAEAIKELFATRGISGILVSHVP